MKTTMMNIRPVPAPADSNSSRKAGDIFNFDQLNLVERGILDSQASTIMPLSLHDCVGFLKRLPLKPPNADLKIPTSIARMVNVLTEPTAAADFFNAQDFEEEGRPEGAPGSAYDPTSDLMKKKLKATDKRTCHHKAPGIFGHIVAPGCMSFYMKDGLTYAVSEGRWWFGNMKASWIAQNVSLNEDLIKPSSSKVLIVRILPGEIGLVREQGVEMLLDVGIHVFNSGTVAFHGKFKFSVHAFFDHGRYHYLRVSRGQYGKVWCETMQNSVKVLVPRLLDQGKSADFVLSRVTCELF